MPSNKELIAHIKRLDASAEVEGLSNNQLSAKLKGLRAAGFIREGSEELQADVKSEDPPPRYYVAKGHAVVGKRGVLGPGEEIIPRDGADISALLLNEVVVAK